MRSSFIFCGKVFIWNLSDGETKLLGAKLIFFFASMYFFSLSNLFFIPWNCKLGPGLPSFTQQWAELADSYYVILPLFIFIQVIYGLHALYFLLWSHNNVPLAGITFIAINSWRSKRKRQGLLLFLNRSHHLSIL